MSGTSERPCARRRLHVPSVAVPADRLEDAEDQILLGLRLARRFLDEETTESLLGVGSAERGQKLDLREPPVSIRGANAVDEEVLGEELARVHRSLSLEDGTASGP